MKLRALNDAGLSRFNAYLDSLRIDPSLPPPREILDDPEFTTGIGADIELTDEILASRMGAAWCLHAALASITEPERNKGMWAWLSLFFFDSVCPPDGNGHRKQGERPRHIPEVGNYQRYYRHLLLGPYLIFRFFEKNPDAALALLWQQNRSWNTSMRRRIHDSLRNAKPARDERPLHLHIQATI